MKVRFVHSHLNGLEWLHYHKPGVWQEIESTVKAIDAEACRTKQSKEKTKSGLWLISPTGLNREFEKHLKSLGWSESRTSYWVTDDAELIRQTLPLPAAEQKEAIEATGAKAISSYNQTDFVKERVAIEVQFGKYSFIAYDLFVKHLAFYVGNEIDLGIEILPTKQMQAEMSSGPGYYESALYDLVRNGRSVPAVPLVLLGVEPD
jgi:hypothetical protein